MYTKKFTVHKFDVSYLTEDNDFLYETVWARTAEEAGKLIKRWYPNVEVFDSHPVEE